MTPPAPLPSLLTPFQLVLEQLAITRRPSTTCLYRAAMLGFLRFLSSRFPHLSGCSELRRDPHLHGYLQHLCQRTPPLSKKSRYNHLVYLRRLLDDLARTAIDPPPTELLLWSDIPRLDVYLPRPLSIADDRRLCAHLNASDDIAHAALRLIRATGMRIGECLDLTTESLLQPGPGRWAIHVPIGKLHTERAVPIDEPTRATFLRLLELRRAFRAAPLSPYLLPRRRGRGHWYLKLRLALRCAASQAGCSTDHITPHQLRHTFATEMVRAGIALPALMQLLGHRDIRMTLRYVQVTHTDLEREFRLARQRLASVHSMPALPIPGSPPPDRPALAEASDTLLAARRLLEISRRDTHEPRARKTLNRIANRMAKLSQLLRRIALS